MGRSGVILMARRVFLALEDTVIGSNNSAVGGGPGGPGTVGIHFSGVVWDSETQLFTPFGRGNQEPGQVTLDPTDDAKDINDKIIAKMVLVFGVDKHDVIIVA